MTTTITNQLTSPPPLPRYGIREDEMTKPGVVLFDWNSDDATVVAAIPNETFEPLGEEDVEQYLGDEDLEEDLEDDALESDPYYYSLAPHWRGVGRKPGAVAITVVLSLCVAIGLVALLAPADAYAGAQSVQAEVASR